MNDTIETTLLLNLFYFALLDEDADELKRIDPDLAEEYQETISYLDSLSDEDYQSLKEELLQQIEVN